MTRGRLWAILGLTLLSLASTLGNLRNEFVQDDFPIIAKDSSVHTLANPGVFFGRAYWHDPFPPALYRPLATLGFAAQWVASGGEPWFFRLVSDLLYLACGVALFLLAVRLLPPIAAWLTAAFFVVHPVHVEAVAVAVNQSEIMVGLAAILTVILLLRVRDRARLRWTDGVALFGLYLIAILFKETGLVIVGLIVAAELTVVQSSRSMRERIAEVRPLILIMLLAATTFFVIRTLALEGDPVGTFTAEALNNQTMWQRALTMLTVVPHWYRLMLWPAHLRGDYSPREIDAATSWGLDQTEGLAYLVSTVIVAILCWRRLPVVTFGLLWAAIGIFPVSNVLIPTGIVLAERTLFLPSIGAMLVVGGLAAPVIARLRQSPRPARLAAGAGAAILLALGVARSADRQADWHDMFTYWKQTVEDAPLSYRARMAYGQLLFERKMKGMAEKEFKAAMTLFPEQWGVYYNFADKLRLEGYCDAAVNYYRKTLYLEPAHETARTSMMACLFHLGRYDDVKAEAKDALSYAVPHYRLFQRLALLADSAKEAKAPPGTVSIKFHPEDTMP